MKEKEVERWMGNRGGSDEVRQVLYGATLCPFGVRRRLW